MWDSYIVGHWVIEAAQANIEHKAGYEEHFSHNFQMKKGYVCRSPTL